MAVLQGYQLIAVEWSMVTFTLFLVILRLWSRQQLRGTIVSWYDGFTVVAWICFLVETSLDTALWKLRFFNPKTDALLDTISQDVKSVSSLKILYVEGITYPICMYSIKAAILCFYHQLIPRNMRRTRNLMWFTVGYVAVGFVTGVSLAAFACQPISRNWSMDPEKYCGSTWSWLPGITVPAVFHLSSDLILYCIPFPLLRVVILPRRQKIGIGVTFGLGFLCVFFAVAALVSSYISPLLAVGWLSACFEQTWAVTVACAPTFRHFLVKDVPGIVRRVRNNGSSSGRRTTQSGNTDRGQHGGPQDIEVQEMADADDWSEARPKKSKVFVETGVVMQEMDEDGEMRRVISAGGSSDRQIKN